MQLQVVYAFWLAYKHIVANARRIFQNISFTKVLNSWNDLEGHWYRFGDTAKI